MQSLCRDLHLQELEFHLMSGLNVQAFLLGPKSDTKALRQLPQYPEHCYVIARHLDRIEVRDLCARSRPLLSELNLLGSLLLM